MDFRGILRRCAAYPALAPPLHAVLIVSGRSSNPLFSTTLISLYSRRGDLRSSTLAFQHTAAKNVFSYNSMISAFVHNHMLGDALSCFRSLLVAGPGARPDEFSFPVALKACPGFREGQKMHSLIQKLGIASNAFVSSGLVHMYGRFGKIWDAEKVFDVMPYRDSGVWNSLVSGFCQNGFAGHALGVFEEMVAEGAHVDTITITSVLPVCAVLNDPLMGMSIHVFSIKHGFDEELFVSNALIDMYSKLGFLQDARRIFECMATRDIVSWNSIVSAYEQAGFPSAAVWLYSKMGEDFICPDRLTLVSLASTIAQIGDLRSGMSVHAYVVRRSWDAQDVAVGNAVMDMYAKLCRIDFARSLFDRMPNKDAITWNTLISCYSQNGQSSEAIKVFEDMEKNEGIIPVQGTLVSVLPAYSHIGALQQGMRIHGRSIRIGLCLNIYVATCLLDMYAKCGRLYEVTALFEEVPRWSAGPWNAVIAAYGIHGYGDKAVDFFSEMQELRVRPDSVTFVSLLSACSHSGLVDCGRQCFQLMQATYGIAPVLKHYACMVDMLGRAGFMDEAYDFIINMPHNPDSGVWGALLGACRIHGNVELGMLASKHLFEIDPENVGYYVLLSNMFARVGRWDGVDDVRSLAKHRQLKKTPGWSSTEVKNKVHVFYNGNQSHPQYDEIYRETAALSAKMKALGYVPDYSFVLQDVEVDEKEHILMSHSERLAISYSIISTSPRSPINIFKNLRVCSDCHNATKFISVITEREILVRDSNRFHHFKDGNCSCGDYW